MPNSADDILRLALAELAAADLQEEPRDQTLLLRLSKTEKTAMESTAEALGLTLSAYLRRLHSIAWERLGPALQPQARPKTKSKT